jgi:hypothetical protein
MIVSVGTGRSPDKQDVKLDFANNIFGRLNAARNGNLEKLLFLLLNSVILTNC